MILKGKLTKGLNTDVKKFNISRLNTPEGIFKVEGQWHAPHQKIIVSQLEIMSTDGWQILDLKHDTIISLISLVENYIYQHLLVRE